MKILFFLFIILISSFANAQWRGVMTNDYVGSQWQEATNDRPFVQLSEAMNERIDAVNSYYGLASRKWPIGIYSYQDGTSSVIITTNGTTYTGIGITITNMNAPYWWYNASNTPINTYIVPFVGTDSVAELEYAFLSPFRKPSGDEWVSYTTIGSSFVATNFSDADMVFTNHTGISTNGVNSVLPFPTWSASYFFRNHNVGFSFDSVADVTGIAPQGYWNGWTIFNSFGDYQSEYGCTLFRLPKINSGIELAHLVKTSNHVFTTLNYGTNSTDAFRNPIYHFSTNTGLPNIYSTLAIGCVGKPSVVITGPPSLTNISGSVTIYGYTADMTKSKADTVFSNSVLGAAYTNSIYTAESETVSIYSRTNSTAKQFVIITNMTQSTSLPTGTTFSVVWTNGSVGPQYGSPMFGRPLDETYYSERKTLLNSMIGIEWPVVSFYSFSADGNNAKLTSENGPYSNDLAYSESKYQDTVIEYFDSVISTPTAYTYVDRIAGGLLASGSFCKKGRISIGFLPTNVAKRVDFYLTYYPVNPQGYVNRSSEYDDQGRTYEYDGWDTKTNGNTVFVETVDVGKTISSVQSSIVGSLTAPANFNTIVTPSSPEGRYYSGYIAIPQAVVFFNVTDGFRYQ